MFYRYVKTKQSANAAAVRRIHGMSYAELQDCASDGFGTVGAEWLAWLDALLHKDRPSVFAVWNGLPVFSALCARS